jgi:hypothetical protein
VPRGADEGDLPYSAHMVSSQAAWIGRANSELRRNGPIVGFGIVGIGTAFDLRYGFIVPAVLALVLLFLAPAFNPKPVDLEAVIR